MELLATQPIRSRKINNLAPDLALFALETLKPGFRQYQLLKIGFHQSRSRSIKLGGRNPRLFIGLIIHRNCDIAHVSPVSQGNPPKRGRPSHQNQTFAGTIYGAR